MTAAQLGPWLFVSIGNGWIRVDQIAAVTQWEIVLVGQSAPIPLGDDVEPDDVLRWIDSHIRRLDHRASGEWRPEGVVADGPAVLR
jgi:hypothetical protein